MRPGGACAGLGHAALQQRDRLLGGQRPQRGEQVAGVGQPLDVRAHDLGLRVGERVAAELGRVHVDGVAERDHLREAQPAQLAVVDGRVGVGTALRPERHGAALLRAAAGEGQAAGGHVEPQAVGAHEADAQLLGAPHDAVLQGQPIGLARLGEARREEVDAADALRPGLLQHRFDQVGRDRRDDVVDRAGDAGQRRVDGQARDLAAPRVDRVHPRATLLDQVIDEAHRPRLARRADDGHGAGAEDRVQGVRRHGKLLWGRTGA